MASAAVGGERVDQGFEAAHLDGGRCLDLVARSRAPVDVESRRDCVAPVKFERRIVRLGQEADTVSRDRSGRSGRRRGSQKPGTAWGAASTAGRGGVAAAGPGPRAGPAPPRSA